MNKKTTEISLTNQLIKSQHCKKHSVKKTCFSCKFVFCFCNFTVFNGISIINRKKINLVKKQNFSASWDARKKLSNNRLLCKITFSPFSCKFAVFCCNFNFFDRISKVHVTFLFFYILRKKTVKNTENFHIVNLLLNERDISIFLHVFLVQLSLQQVCVCACVCVCAQRVEMSHLMLCRRVDMNPQRSVFSSMSELHL